MNKRRKGNYIQNLIERKLIKQGYIVHNQKSIAFQIKPGIWISKRNDIWGIFDLIAIKQGENTKWIQSTADTNIIKRLEKFIKIPLNLEYNDVELWQYKGRGKFRILRLKKNRKELEEVRYNEEQNQKNNLFITK